MNPLVSVNLATYNRAHLVSRAISSVLSQTYLDLEIIVVDDCSDDDTWRIVDKYKKQDSRVKYIRHNTNKKLAVSRNTALRESRGKYIAFMDDDDEWIDRDKISKQVAMLESLPCRTGLICTGVLLVSEDGRRQEKFVRHPADLVAHILARNGIIYSPTVMVRRAIIEEIGGFDERVVRGVDSDFYRTCTVIFRYDVYFMSDITTAVHEYGSDRMTQTDTECDLLNHVDNFELKLIKFEKELKRHIASKAFIEFVLAKLYYKLYIRTRKTDYKKNFMKYAKKAFKSKVSPVGLFRH